MENFDFSNEYEQSLDAFVYTCGYEKCEPSHSFGPVIRSGYMIHSILDGKGIYLARGRKLELSAGDAFLIVPGEPVYYEADETEPWTYAWMGFHGAKIENYIERTSLLDTLVCSYGDDERFFYCHEKMYGANRAGRNKDLLMNSVLHEFLFMLAEKFPNQNVTTEKKTRSYVEEAVRFVDSNYQNPVNIAKIAQELNVNRSYLYRLFKERTGISLQEYLLNVRISRACRMLADSDYPVGMIALSVGYEDAMYFSRLFKSRKGVSPSRYRKIHLKSE